MKKNPKNSVQEPPEETAPQQEDEQDTVEARFPGPSAVEGSRPESAGTAAPEPSPAERQRDEFKDLLLRKAAEFENFRKRTDRERQTLSETAATGMIEELLPLVDDMERALNVDPETEATDAYRKGVELIHRQLRDMLRRRGVTPIEALGVAFDPHYHQAVSYEPAEDRAEGEIIEEFRRGYMLGDRLLRPSMVKVAKG